MLKLQPTITAQWHELVSEAQATCHCWLDHDLESYLVFLLMRFTSRPEMAAAVLATEYLQTLQRHTQIQQDQLRDVGDQCLLYAGLFPERATRKRVNSHYFTHLGQSAYQQLASLLRHGDSRLFQHIAEYFQSMSQILNVMREVNSDIIHYTDHGKPLPGHIVSH